MERLDISEIKDRCASVPAGPWHSVCGDDVYAFNGQRICDIRGWGFLTSRLGLSEDDALKSQADIAQFIAHSREDIPAMVAEIERLSGERDAIRDGILAATEFGGCWPATLNE